MVDWVGQTDTRQLYFLIKHSHVFSFPRVVLTDETLSCPCHFPTNCFEAKSKYRLNSLTPRDIKWTKATCQRLLKLRQLAFGVIKSEGVNLHGSPCGGKFFHFVLSGAYDKLRLGYRGWRCLGLAILQYCRQRFCANSSENMTQSDRKLCCSQQARLFRASFRRSGIFEHREKR